MFFMCFLIGFFIGALASICVFNYRLNNVLEEYNEKYIREHQENLTHRKKCNDLMISLSDLLDNNFNHNEERFNDIDRCLTDLRTSLDAAKPIKPNNWNSVKEAFKGPVRIEVNERN